MFACIYLKERFSKIQSQISSQNTTLLTRNKTYGLLISQLYILVKLLRGFFWVNQMTYDFVSTSSWSAHSYYYVRCSYCNMSIHLYLPHSLIYIMLCLVTLYSASWNCTVIKLHMICYTDSVCEAKYREFLSKHQYNVS